MAHFSPVFRRTLLIILAIILAEGLFVLLLQGTGDTSFFRWAGKDGGDSAGSGVAYSEDGMLMPGEVEAPPPPPQSYLPEEIRTIRPDAPQASAQERAQANEILLHANRAFSQMQGTYDAYVAALLQLTLRIVRKLLWMLLVLWGITLISFWVIHLAPGSPTDM